MRETIEYPAPGLLRELLSYNPQSGEFRWGERQGKARRFSGSVAGCAMPIGYIGIRINGRLLYAHRLAWVMMTGEQPPEIIDHINGNGLDNRWANLRRSNSSGNTLNSSRAFGHARLTGCRNVTYQEGRSLPFKVQLVIDGRRLVARFDNLLDAAACAFSARSRAAENAHLG